MHVFVATFFVIWRPALSVNGVSDSDVDFLRNNFLSLRQCSASFARVTAMAAYSYVAGKRKTSFADEFRVYLGKSVEDISNEYATLPKDFVGIPIPDLPTGEEECFPLKKKSDKKSAVSINNVNRFFSMTAENAQLIAAAIRFTLQGGVPLTAYRLSTIASVSTSISDVLSDDQLQVAYIMGLAVTYGSTFQDDVCEGGKNAKVGAQFADSVPEFKQGFDQTDYFSTLFRLLRRIRSCKNVDDDLARQRNLLEPNSSQFREIGGLQAILDRISVRGTGIPVQVSSVLADELFIDQKTCSSTFAKVVAVAVNEFIDTGGNFNTILTQWLSADSKSVRAGYQRISNLQKGLFGDLIKPGIRDGEDLCLPMKSHSSEFFSMDQSDARVIAAALKYAAVQLSKSSQVRSVGTIASSILESLSKDQRDIVNGMSLLIDFQGSLTVDICLSDPPQIAPQFERTIPLMSKELHGNYLPTVFMFLRRLATCAGDDHLLLLDPTGPEYMSFLRKLVIQQTKKNEQQPQQSPANSQSPVPITTAMFVASSIANQEKIFFTNFNDAAQQLSLLGIKAVGLATQIQAIRGHIMMLQLIDGHISQLNADHERYTKLLIQAHDQLAAATGP